MQAAEMFEYTCPECGRGTVLTTRIHNYKTKIKGYPFVVDEALIGECDECGARSFDPEETKRWEELFSRSLEAHQAFLTPEEIKQLRKDLGISMEDFARLIGTTRQSVSMWEKESRTTPPVRTADLLMKLVRQSLAGEPVDVLPFLLNEARKWGVVIELRRPVLPMGKNKNAEFGRSDREMKSAEEKSEWLARLKAVREKYERLNHFPSVIAPDIWGKVQKVIESESAKPQNLKLPVLFFLLDRRDIEALHSIDQFLAYLRKSGDKRHRKELGQLVRRLQDRTDYRTPTAALFEMEILISLLEKSPEGSVNLYPQIQNKNFPEAKILLGEKTIYLEATLLSQTEDQERVWEIAHEQDNPSQKEMKKLRIREVSHHPSFSIVTGNGDPHSDALRLVRKIGGKQKQLASQRPNIICIGISDLSPDSLSLKWGADAVFSGDLKPAQSIIRRQKTYLSNDKKLSAVESQKIRENIQSLEKWDKEFEAESRLTGILVFQWESAGFLPKGKFINPSPLPESQLSEAEWRTILDRFGFP